MLTKVKRILIFSFLHFASMQTSLAQDPVKWVDPMTGTGGVGHTYPGATVPYGMVQVSPDTRRDASWEGCSGYYYPDSLIFGFSHTHLSGTGCSDYGDILLMPGLENSSFDPIVYGSPFSHADEVAAPGYYAVSLTDDTIRAEMTATTRTAMHRYAFPAGRGRTVLLDMRHRDKTLGSRIRFVSPTCVEGYRHSEAWARDQYVFFSLELSEPVNMFLSNREGKVMKPGMEMEGNDLAVIFRLPPARPSAQPLLVKVGISTVDIEGARRNLAAESPDWDFDGIRRKAKEEWNRELGRIVAEGGTERERKNFYTALYHAMVVPNVLSDVDGRYRGRDDAIHTADGYTQYTVFSLWDTFRAAHPLYTLIDRHRTLDYIRTFLAQYRQGGRLPVWELSSNETDCMIGYHSIPVISDALVKGIGGFDTTLALEAMVKSATWDHLGIPAYVRRGYIAVEDEHESVSKTLEYAFDDWCISEVARICKKEDVRQRYLLRSMSYRNLFDPETGFMRPRRNGDFIPGFDPREVNNHFTEANSWQYSFFVPHDIGGLVNLLGGPAEASAKLDALFSAPTTTTGRNQADITGLIGQYAHGNEPSHHMAYLYDYLGQPWKTQRLVRTIMDSLYQQGPEGLPGNEDCGQMSAWYVWSAMGFYPVTPGSPVYAIGSPVFDSLQLKLESGNTVLIKTTRRSRDEVYVKELRIDGKVQRGNLISHDQLVNAKEINFIMSRTPDTLRGRSVQYNPTNNLSGFSRAPRITSKGRLFADSMVVEMVAPDGGSILYSDNGDSLDIRLVYSGPLVIRKSTDIHAVIEKDGRKSGLTSASYYRVPSGMQVMLQTKPSRQYSAEGPVSMVDGIRGDVNWKKGDWHGYQGRDMEVEVRMDEARIIHAVGAGFLQDVRPWIFMPRELIVETSEDGQNWKEAGRAENTVKDTVMEAMVQELKVTFPPRKAQSVRVRAVNYGKLPVWHPGAGYDAYIFCDEIIIE